jgi:hypothetical protein
MQVKIVLDYEKNEVYAGRIKDSTGKYQYQTSSNTSEVEPDSIRFISKLKNLNIQFAFRSR